MLHVENLYTWPLCRCPGVRTTWSDVSVTAALLVSTVTPTADHVTVTRQGRRRKCATPSRDSVCARWATTHTHTRTCTRTHALCHTRLPAACRPLQENVQGSRCDQCRVGTFHLDPTNPKGCTSCFCFGATDRCRSSDKRRTEVPSAHSSRDHGRSDGRMPLGTDPPAFVRSSLLCRS